MASRTEDPAKQNNPSTQAICKSCGAQFDLLLLCYWKWLRDFNQFVAGFQPDHQHIQVAGFQSICSEDICFGCIKCNIIAAYMIYHIKKMDKNDATSKKLNLKGQYLSYTVLGCYGTYSELYARSWYMIPIPLEKN